jgi:hypothetical protein
MRHVRERSNKLDPQLPKIREAGVFLSGAWVWLGFAPSTSAWIHVSIRRGALPAVAAGLRARGFALGVSRSGLLRQSGWPFENYVATSAPSARKETQHHASRPPFLCKFPVKLSP